MENKYLIFDPTVFVKDEVKFEEMHSISDSSEINYCSGVLSYKKGDRIDYLILNSHGNPKIKDLWTVKRKDIPQCVIDKVKKELTYSEMEAEGWFPSIEEL